MQKLGILTSPILLKGDARTAYRDPAAYYLDGVWHLYFTWVYMPEGETQPYMSVGHSMSENLKDWSDPVRLTKWDRSKNFSSPGNVIELADGSYALCIQTYCRENGEKYGNENCRLYLMRSKDLYHFEEPELLKVKGDVPEREMGRMIDPYIIKKDGLWWCFFKQNGVSFSTSADLKNWTFRGHADAGENVCVIEHGEEYVLFHSPKNGIGMKKSRDLINWADFGGLITLDQANWPWAKGRLTAGFVCDARNISGIGCYVMFFHGSGPQDEEVCFDNTASIGIAYSENLIDWHWPGKM